MLTESHKCESGSSYATAHVATGEDRYLATRSRYVHSLNFSDSKGEWCPMNTATRDADAPNTTYKISSKGQIVVEI